MEFQFIISIQKHRIFDFIAVPLLVYRKKGEEYYTIERTVYKENLYKINFEFSTSEIELVGIIDDFSDSHLCDLFSKNKDVVEFFSSLDEGLIQKQIRPYIERRLIKILDVLKSTQVRIFLKESKIKNLYNSDEIFIVQHPAESVFNFIRDESLFRYFLSIKVQETEMKLSGKKGILITNEPCRIILNNKIYFFSDIDGKKLQPFFTKEFVTIPASSEKKYIETFVVPSVKKYHVHTKGIDIVNDNPLRKAQLSLEKDWKDNPVLLLKFQYDEKNFLANNLSEKIVKLEIRQENGKTKYIIHKLTRDKEWENLCIKKLVELGLNVENKGTFKLSFPVDYPYEAQQLDFINWLNDNGARLSEFGFELKQGFFKKTYFTGQIRIDVQIQQKIDWFDIFGFVYFGDVQIPFLKLKNHISKGIREFILPNGDVAVLPEEWFAEYKDLMVWGDEENGHLKVKKFHFQLIKEDPVKPAKYLQAFKRFTTRNLDIIDIPHKIKADLRSYQRQGFSWLSILQEFGFGGCLADDMGLGKTLQAITLLTNTIDQHQNETPTEEKPKYSIQLSLFDTPQPSTPTPTKSKSRSSLIVVPTSLVHNWEDEFRKFAPHLKISKYVGSRQSQASLFKNSDIIITSYGIVRNDIHIFSAYQFLYIILDESQQIKNPESKTYDAILRLKGNFRLALTGTPIQNSLIDLWAQMNFLNPGLLGNIEFFKEYFAIPIEKERDINKQTKLQTLIQPFILRRTKAEVAPELPPVTDQVIYCEMNEFHKKLYEEEKSKIRNRIIDVFQESGVEKTTFLMLQGLTRLRLLANHPALLFNESTIESEKFKEVVESIENLIAENHKVLIFSSFVKHLRIFEQYFQQQAWDYSMLIGSTKQSLRGGIISEFQNQPDKRIFLISLKAGGVGLNLTAADYVFILDPWWNPAQELQAINRAHRIGQNKNVFVYRFISSNSIEEKIQILQHKKLILADTFVNSNNPFIELDINTIKDLFE